MKFGYGYDDNGILTFQFIAENAGEETAFNELDQYAKDKSQEIKMEHSYKNGISELRLFVVPIEEVVIDEGDRDPGND